MSKRKNKGCKKYKNYTKLAAIAKSLNVLKCIVNALIFKFFVIKIVTVADVVIKNQMTNTRRQCSMH